MFCKTVCSDCGSSLWQGCLPTNGWAGVWGDCGEFISVKKGTVMQSSKLPIRKWIVAIYLIAVNPKGVSSVRLAELLGVTQSTAWHLMQKIREGFSPEDLVKLRGVVEVDETYIGGKEKNKHWDKKQRSGRGPIGKMAVIGAKQRNGNVIAMLIENTDTQTLEQFISDHIQEGSVMLSRRPPRIPEPAPQL